MLLFTLEQFTLFLRKARDFQSSHKIYKFDPVLIFKETPIYLVLIAHYTLCDLLSNFAVSAMHLKLTSMIVVLIYKLPENKQLRAKKDCSMAGCDEFLIDPSIQRCLMKR